MVRFHGVSTDRRTYYGFDTPLEFGAEELRNLRGILGPYLSPEDLKKVPSVEVGEVNGVLRPIGYKVVTAEGLSSLGLRGNPNILSYPIGEWFSLSEEDVFSGTQDEGGIFVARVPKGAKYIHEYMAERYGVDTRVFRTAIEDIVHLKDGSIKTNSVLMFEEMFF